MSQLFSGHVLRAVNTSPVNAQSTAEAVTGVVRDVKPLPDVYDIPGPDFVDARADQYRASILLSPGTTSPEYLVWAQNTANLTTVDDPSWQLEKAIGVIPPGGDLPISSLNPNILLPDGIDRFLVHDPGNRSLGSVYWVVIARGDVKYDDKGWVDIDSPVSGRKGDNPYLYFPVVTNLQSSGVVYLTSDQIDQLGGGLSIKRGDVIVSVRYTLSPARFWWTRNDRYETRFGWDNKTQRWRPYKGSCPKNLGLLSADNLKFKMDPKINNLPVGSYLPGSDDPDAYSMIRLGSEPGMFSIPVTRAGNWLGIKVIPDNEVSGFDFANAPYLSGVMGQFSGDLSFNPDFANTYAGRHIWYSPKKFTESDTGIVGKVLDATKGNLYIAPIPGPDDCPLLRIGNRQYLTAKVFQNDTLLETATRPKEGEVWVSLSTGRVILSLADIRKSDPSSSSFDIHYLGDDLIYDGVALNAIPQPTQKPVRLLDGDGNPATGKSKTFYVPDSAPLPDNFTGYDIYRGLGVSGIIDAPDGTGSLPKRPDLPASVRPGGDSQDAINTGRIRQVLSDVGDTFIFSKDSVITDIKVVDYGKDLSTKLKTGHANIAKVFDIYGSKVTVNKQFRKDTGDDGVYFLQSTFNPAVYTNKPRILSRNRDVFRFSGSEILYFAINGYVYEWEAISLINQKPDNDFFTAQEVSESLASLIDDNGSVYELSGRIVIDALSKNGTVEIGFGSNDKKDLSGAAVLGFLPGWRVKGGVDNWLVEGVSVGLFRSPMNLDRKDDIADFNSTVRIENGLVSENIQPTPYVFLDNPPLQDVAGIDDGVYFSVTSTDADGNLIIRPLKHYKDIVHRFGQGKFDWVANGVLDNEFSTPASIVSFGKPNIVPESLSHGLGGLYVSNDDGVMSYQTPDVDYLLSQDGIPGTAILTERIGERVAYGVTGLFTESGFTDELANFKDLGIETGYRLKTVTGSYIVKRVIDSYTLELEPKPEPSGNRYVAWELFKGYSESVYDPALIADMFYEEFRHLETEPFKVRTLTPLGLLIENGPRLRADFDTDRIVNIRYGLDKSNTAELLKLRSEVLGIIANHKLKVPIKRTQFSIQLGTEKFKPVPVSQFSDVLDNDRIEYLSHNGTLCFADNLLTKYASSRVVYVEDFMPPESLPALTIEYDRGGYLNIPSTDIDKYQGSVVYCVQQMITENRRDVALNPQLGAFAFITPVSKGVIVEVEYFKSDLEGRATGDVIVEVLPVFVRNEVAHRIDGHTYTFNPDKLTVDHTVDPIIFTGAIMKNFGTTDVIVSYPESLEGLGQIKFLKETLDPDTVVKVTYAVFEAQGGERAYETSTKPIYRPPFFIKANQSRFGLRGDRVKDFVPGQLLRLGDDCYYVKSTKLYEGGERGPITSVDIFPSTITESGSRAPAGDALALISCKPITSVVDPDGKSPISTNAPAGFLQSIDLDTFPFGPISRGQSTVTFTGNLTKFAVPGHILEISGYPYTISQVKLSDDGNKTVIHVTSPFRVGNSIGINKPTVKLSVRPIYPPETQDFVGLGPLVDTEPYDLIKFDGMSPGRTLVPNIDYTIDGNTGGLHLNEAMGGVQKLFLSFTKVRVLSPVIRDGVIFEKHASGTFLHVESPDLTGSLTGTYTISNPDTFYFRAVTMPSFLGEIAQEAVAEISAGQPASGPMKPAGSTKNWNQGRLGLNAQYKHLLDKDRAARIYLAFYNQTVQFFEQIDETITGKFIGDRDGKFRFWYGTGKDYPTPGYEDPITGVLHARYVWCDVFNSRVNSDDNYITVLPDDWFVTPESFTLTTGDINGRVPSSDYLNNLLIEQFSFIDNDIDDVIVTKLGKTKTVWKGFSRRLQAKAQTAKMSESHRFSRLFPTLTRAYLTTYPGAGSDSDDDPGVYTWGRFIDGEWRSTHGKDIGQLSNPVIGDINNVEDAELSIRRARARIWKYLPEGIPQNVFDNGTSPAITGPCLIATPAFLHDLMINPDTGFPFDNQFISQHPNGSLPDVLAGDLDLMTPGFTQGDELTWGFPDGSSLRAQGGLFVHEVLYGCVITFQDSKGQRITIPDDILVESTPAHVYPIRQGDTIYTGPTVSVPDEPADPPDRKALMQMTEGINTYRKGFDVRITPEGVLKDKTYPSIYDPSFPVKELAGQKPPKPLSPLEGLVSFVYDSETPYPIPALSGEIFDDSGDCQYPFLRSSNTELDRFGEVSTELADILVPDYLNIWGVYPDELLSNDVSVVNNNRLQFPFDLTSNARPYDLMFVQVENESPFIINNDPVPGPMGIYSIAKVGGDSVAIPRFITPTTPPLIPGSNQTGSPVTYTFNKAISFIDNSDNYPYNGEPQSETIPPPGVEFLSLSDDDKTYLRFNSIGSLALNNGVTPGVGNLNDFLSVDNDNKVVIHIYARWDKDINEGLPGDKDPLWPVADPGGREILTITLQTNKITVKDYQDNETVYNIGSPPIFGTAYDGTSYQDIEIPGYDILPWLSEVPGGVSENEWVIPFEIQYDLPNTIRRSLYGYEFAIDVIGKSNTAWISDDRLTFNEVIDMRRALPKGTKHPLSNINMEANLTINSITVGNTHNTSITSTVNNLSVPLTFPTFGTWDPLDNNITERGSIQVYGYEGLDNRAMTGDHVTAAILPSNENDQKGPILSGTGFTGGFNKITDITVNDGSLSNVVPGDIVVIDKSANPGHIASTMCGTYLVRHVVSESDEDIGIKKITMQSRAGNANAAGWCPVHFPTVVGYDQTTHKLTLSDYAPVGNGYEINPGDISGFTASGRLYFILNQNHLASTDEMEYRYSVISCEYTALSTNPSKQGIFTINPSGGSFLDAAGNTLPDDESTFVSLIKEGVSVSGMRYWPVNINGGLLPENNSVGLDAGNAVYGLRWVSLIPPPFLQENLQDRILVFSGNPSDDLKIKKSPGDPDTLVPLLALAKPGNTMASPDDVLYDGIINTLDVGNITAASWHTLNVPPSSWGGENIAIPLSLKCILPDTTLALQNRVDHLAGFYAQAGIFLEPTFPRMATNLTSDFAHIVDKNHSLPYNPDINSRFYGMRDSGSPEEVNFTVRRIRRFHKAELTHNLKPLQYAYEIRRGVVTGYSFNADRQVGKVSAKSFMLNGQGPYTGTQLGGFDNSDVNIHSGDIFRLLDNVNKVIDSVPIAHVMSDGEILLKMPGLVSVDDPTGYHFEIFLKHTPVPHEQSNMQLLELITDKEVWQTEADWNNDNGGYVQETNKLSDSSLSKPYTSMGIKEGDIVIIDPAGDIPLIDDLPVFPEKGGRPLGDKGVIERTSPGVYVPGRPTITDDNRGFYRVVKITPTHIEVDPDNTFTQTFLSDDDQRAYSIYPTIHDSEISDSRIENPMDLRPTAPRDVITMSFKERSGNLKYHSIEPFSYRIIRPSSLFSKEAVDLILMHRERILSLIEFLKRLLAGYKNGTYYDFQKYEHISDLGDTRDPESGLGVVSNEYLMSIIGRTDVTPFANNGYCMSLLDRRFWIKDTQLNSLTSDDTNPFNMTPVSPGKQAYAAYDSDIDDDPVLPDLIDEVLDTRDRFRAVRQIWLNYRVHKVLGTLAAIERFEKQLPKTLADQARAFEQLKSLKDV